MRSNGDGMTDPALTRQGALALLHEYTRSEGLRRHALAVEAAMVSYAAKFGEDPVRWGITGLLHDFDYEKFPLFPDHPTEGNRVLRNLGYPEDILNAILGHVPEMNVSRETLMAKTLFACDELSGFVMACALVRPSGLEDMKNSSVKKKMKDKAFAKGVNRDHIMQGAEELGVPLDEHIDAVINALRGVGSELGL